MKKLLVLTLVLVMVLGVVSISKAEVANDPKVTLVYAEVNPEDSLMGKTANVFKEKVEELTGGSVTIDLQASGVLGAEKDVLDTMIGGAGTIDIARISAFSLTSYGTKKSALLAVPYTFANRAHFWKFANGDKAASFLSEPAEIGLGVTGLFYAEEGFRHFFFAKEVASMADLAGTKIRVSTDPTMTGMVEGLGASPTVVAFGELYAALSSGVVDGAEQPIANYQSNKFYEVAPYMILDAHTMGAAEVIITEEALAKLTDGQKAAIIEAGKAASEFNAGLSEENEQACLEEMKAAGVTFVEVTNLQEWQDACKDVIASCITGLETEYQEILDLAK